MRTVIIILAMLFLASCDEAKVKQKLFCRMHMTDAKEHIFELNKQVMRGEVKIKTLLDLEAELDVIDGCLRATEGIY